MLQNAQIRIHTIKTIHFRNRTRSEMSPVITRLRKGLNTLEKAQNIINIQAQSSSPTQIKFGPVNTSVEYRD